MPPLTAVAQYISSPHDARSSAMGGCLLPDLETRHVDLSYRQGFLLAGMSDKRLSLVCPTGKVGVTALQYLHHGNLDYHEQQVSAGYALRPLPWLMVGVAADYLNVGTSDPAYRPQHWLAAVVGASAAIGDRTQVALLAGTRPWDRQHLYRLHAQVQYSPITGLLTVLEGEMEERMRMRMGMEYSYGGTFLFRAGISTAPLIGTFGLGFRHKSFRVDIAAEFHQSLGVTPHTTLLLCF